MTIMATDVDVDELLKDIFDETPICEVHPGEGPEYCNLPADWRWIFERVCEHVPDGYNICDPHHHEMMDLTECLGLRCKICMTETPVKEVRKL